MRSLWLPVGIYKSTHVFQDAFRCGIRFNTHQAPLRINQLHYRNPSCSEGLRVECTMTSKTVEVGDTGSHDLDDAGDVKRSHGQAPSDLSGSDENGLTSEKNPFNDQTVALYWRTAYEKSNYECRHVFDPSLTWSEEEEKRLVRKLDWRVCLWAVSEPKKPLNEWRPARTDLPSVSCSSLSKSIEGTSPRRCRTTCWTILE